MIDTKELRRIAEESYRFAGEAADEIERLRADLEEAKSAWEEADKSCRDLTEKVIPNIREQLESAEKERDALRIENEALRAEVIHIKEVEFPRKAQAVADGWRTKCERLEAKIEAMERQVPHSYIYRYRNPLDGSPVWRHESGNWNGQQPGACAPLYALPGAKGEEK